MVTRHASEQGNIIFQRRNKKRESIKSTTSGKSQLEEVRSRAKGVKWGYADSPVRISFVRALSLQNFTLTTNKNDTRWNKTKWYKYGIEMKRESSGKGGAGGNGCVQMRQITLLGMTKREGEKKKFRVWIGDEIDWVWMEYSVSIRNIQEHLSPALMVAANEISNYVLWKFKRKFLCNFKLINILNSHGLTSRTVSRFSFAARVGFGCGTLSREWVEIGWSKGRPERGRGRGKGKGGKMDTRGNDSRGFNWPTCHPERMNKWVYRLVHCRHSWLPPVNIPGVAAGVEEHGFSPLASRGQSRTQWIQHFPIVIALVCSFKSFFSFLPSFFQLIDDYSWKTATNLWQIHWRQKKHGPSGGHFTMCLNKVSRIHLSKYLG